MSSSDAAPTKPEFPVPRLNFQSFYTLNEKKHTLHISFFIDTGAFEITLDNPDCPNNSPRRGNSPSSSSLGVNSGNSGSNHSPSRSNSPSSPRGTRDAPTTTSYLLPALYSKGRRIGCWDLFTGAVLDLLGRPTTLICCDAQTVCWNRYWAEEVLLPRREKLRKILVDELGERLESWLGKGGRRWFVCLKTFEGIRIFDIYRKYSRIPSSSSHLLHLTIFQLPPPVPPISPPSAGGYDLRLLARQVITMQAKLSMKKPGKTKGLGVPPIFFEVEGLMASVPAEFSSDVQGMEGMMM